MSVDVVVDFAKGAWNWMSGNATPIMALAAVVTCYLTVRNMQSSAKTIERVVEMWKTTQRPIIQIERIGRTDDGHNYNHEDIAISNEGGAPRFFKTVEVREFLRLRANGLKGKLWFREVLLPVHFYSAGFVQQKLTGTIYRVRGIQSRKKHFDFERSLRDFAKSKGSMCCSDLIVLVHVAYVDAYGEEQHEYFDASSGMGQTVINETEFNKQIADSDGILQYPGERFEISSLSPEKIWDSLLNSDSQGKVTAKDLEKD